MQKLFFQLIQVSIGTLDCLDRGPSQEEWYQLYHLSQQQGLVHTCYEGVVRLFDFGLRAPQDLSIDWMADTENETVLDELSEPVISNPLRRMLYIRWKERNGSSLIVRNAQSTCNTPSAAVVLLLLKSYEELNQNTLKVSSVVRLAQLLNEAKGTLPDFRDGSSVKQMLETFGIWHFTQAMMWTVGEVAALDAKYLIAGPNVVRGKFLLSQMMDEKHPLVQRIKNWLFKALMF